MGRAKVEIQKSDEMMAVFMLTDVRVRFVPGSRSPGLLSEYRCIYELVEVDV